MMKSIACAAGYCRAVFVLITLASMVPLPCNLSKWAALHKCDDQSKEWELERFIHMVSKAGAGYLPL